MCIYIYIKLRIHYHITILYLTNQAFIEVIEGGHLILVQDTYQNLIRKQIVFELNLYQTRFNHTFDWPNRSCIIGHRSLRIAKSNHALFLIVSILLRVNLFIRNPLGVMVLKFSPHRFENFQAPSKLFLEAIHQHLGPCMCEIIEMTILRLGFKPA